ncbi:gamma-glutamyltransferase, partial [bacterium]|nr:gamma-glutamyltransferase [bacterium]
MKRKLVIIGCILFSIPILLVLILLVINSILHLQNRGFIEGERDGVITKSGMVVTAHPLASQIGVDILKQGGNAFDAAIAVQFALSVVYPKAGNIGGGGFLVYRTSDGTIGSLDFRERAPLKSYRNMFLDEKGNAIKDLSRHGHLSAGVPGTVDGMARLHEKLGSLPFKELVQPSVDLAANGYLLTQKNADNMNNYRELFVKTNRFIPHFVGQKAWKKGERFIQKDLSRTLSMIRDQGRDGFYKGDTALRIIQEMEAGKGIINAEDLDAYRSIWRKPVTADYKNFRIISMPLPSSGGISLIQLLKGARKFNFKVLGHNTHQSIHLMTELERRVFADRATYLGDSDFVKVPVSNLISEDYLQTRFADINPDQKT